MITNNVFIALFLSFPIAVLAWTITRSSLFEMIRTKIQDYSIWLGKLITCPYCCSHWLALILVLIYKIRIVSSSLLFLDYIMSICFIVGCSTLFVWILNYCINNTGNSNEKTITILREALEKAANKIKDLTKDQ